MSLGKSFRLCLSLSLSRNLSLSLSLTVFFSIWGRIRWLDDFPSCSLWSWWRCLGSLERCPRCMRKSRACDWEVDLICLLAFLPLASATNLQKGASKGRHARAGVMHAACSSMESAHACIWIAWQTLYASVFFDVDNADGKSAQEHARYQLGPRSAHGLPAGWDSCGIRRQEGESHRVRAGPYKTFLRLSFILLRHIRTQSVAASCMHIMHNSTEIQRHTWWNSIYV